MDMEEFDFKEISNTYWNYYLNCWGPYLVYVYI
jgi:hypothetical protein